MAEQAIEHLIRIKKESLVLLKDRGYVIPKEEASIYDDTIKPRDFKSKYDKIKNDTLHPLYDYFYGNPLRVAMSNIYYKSGQKCLVYFAESSDKKISDVAVSNFCKLIVSQDVNEAIIVSYAPSSSAMDSLCSEIINKKEGDKYGVFIQFFMDDELMFNPLEHALVPKHRIITEKELQELKEVDRINPLRLPQISLFDPVCKRLGAKEGNVIEVLREVIIEDCLIEEELTFRYVFMPHSVKGKK